MSILIIVAVILSGIYCFLKNDILLTFMITIDVAAYHFLMRYLVGNIVDLIKFNPNVWWFREHKYERKIYKFLNVKKFKKHIPTYKPESFDLSKHSYEEIIASTCGAEVIHEISMLLSFLPLIMIIWYDYIPFLVTSVIASLVDLPFVLIQRYNRPRLVKLNKLKNKDLN